VWPTRGVYFFREPERRLRPDQVAHPQEPVLDIDPTWQRMVNLPSPKSEVKTQNQEKPKMVVLGGRDEPVALLIDRKPTIRGRSGFSTTTSIAGLCGILRAPCAHRNRLAMHAK